MKFGFTFSTIAHVAVLTLAAVSFVGPEAFKVEQVDTINADFIPYEALAQSMQGDRKAKPNKKPSPKKTKKQDNPDAENVGDTKIDKPAVKEPAPKAPVVKQSREKAAKKKAEEEKKKKEAAAAAAKKAAEAKKAEQAKKLAEKEAAEKAAKLAEAEALRKAEEAEKAEEAKKKAEEEKKKKEEEARKAKELAEKKKKEEEARKARELAEKQKKAEEAKKAAEAAAKKKKEQEAKRLAELNKQESGKSGSKSSKNKKSLGTSKTSKGATKLSRNDESAVRAAIEDKWLIPSGMENFEKMRAVVRFRLKPDGSLASDPVAEVTGGSAAENGRMKRSVIIAIKRAVPFDFLPKENYATWKDFKVNFNPSEMM